MLYAHYRLIENITDGTFVIERAFTEASDPGKPPRFHTWIEYDWDAPQHAPRTLLMELAAAEHRLAKLNRQLENSTRESDIAAEENVKLKQDNKRLVEALRALYDDPNGIEVYAVADKLLKEMEGD